MNKQITIRPYEHADLKTISEIEKETFGFVAYPAFFFRQAYDILSDLFLVAESVDGKILGYVMGAFETGSCDSWILSLAVAKEHRRQGVAHALMEQLLQKLIARGAESILLTVDPDNTAAVSFYRKQDFHEIRVENDYFEPKDKRAVMRKKST
ncbi:MAG: GNAT family N-acetyltransferase [Candidatus Latescibacteria bacterium]|nr:GNAT family N-acetyltransferase [Candidatus Latescibacterota bacterium]